MRGRWNSETDAPWYRFGPIQSLQLAAKEMSCEAKITGVLVENRDQIIWYHVFVGVCWQKKIKLEIKVPFFGEVWLKLNFYLPKKSVVSYVTLPAKCWIPKERQSNDRVSNNRGFCLCWALIFDT